MALVALILNGFEALLCGLKHMISGPFGQKIAQNTGLQCTRPDHPSWDKPHTTRSHPVTRTPLTQMICLRCGPHVHWCDCVRAEVGVLFGVGIVVYVCVCVLVCSCRRGKYVGLGSVRLRECQGWRVWGLRGRHGHLGSNGRLLHCSPGDSQMATVPHVSVLSPAPYKCPNPPHCDPTPQPSALSLAADGQAPIALPLTPTPAPVQPLPNGFATPDIGIEDFKCSICLNLLHKPCVNSCGHVFCFWCIQHAMCGVTASRCPLCRAAYAHFPGVCVPLAHFLMRQFPEEAAARARDTEAEEAGMGVQSSPLPDPAPDVSIAELFACIDCHQLPVDPTVPSCGHIVCSRCFAARGKDPCPGAQCTVVAHPVLQPCTMLRELLRAALPERYAARSSAAAAALPPGSGGGGGGGVSPGGGFVHVGVICDGCGAYPIVGPRWRCHDCPEAIGFDVCGACHARGVHQRVSTGKFNQTHAPTHRMELVEQAPDWLVALCTAHPDIGMQDLLRMVTVAGPEDFEVIDGDEDVNAFEEHESAEHPRAPDAPEVAEA